MRAEVESYRAAMIDNVSPGAASPSQAQSSISVTADRNVEGVTPSLIRLSEIEDIMPAATRS